jgi:hypothetical protein
MMQHHSHVWIWAAVLFAALLHAGCILPGDVRSRRYVAPVRIGSFSTRPKSDALIKAVSDGKLAEVRRLLDGGISPNAVTDPKDQEGKSALQIAAETGNVHLVQLLLDKGADINAPDPWGATAVVDAAFVGSPEIVKLLISRGADVNANDDGATALGYAAHQLADCRDATCHRCFQEVVNLLKRAGAREQP